MCGKKNNMHYKFKQKVNFLFIERGEIPHKQGQKYDCGSTTLSLKKKRNKR